jgi:hypothetical protein
MMKQSPVKGVTDGEAEAEAGLAASFDGSRLPRSKDNRA